MPILWLSLLSLAAHAANPPQFSCQNPQGTQFDIQLSRYAKKLVVKEKSKAAREIKFSSPNASNIFNLPGDPLIYNWVNVKATKNEDSLDFRHEIGIHYNIVEGTPHVGLWIVIDHKQERNLTCQSPRFEPGQIHTRLDNAPQVYADLLNKAASLRGKDGALMKVGVSGVDAAIRRMYFSPELKKEDELGLFIHEASPGLLKITPISVDKLRQRFPRNIAKFWNLLLEKIEYQKHRDIERFITWVKEGLRPRPKRSLDSVRGGFMAFSRSKNFDIEQVRKDFATGVTEELLKLTRDELKQINATLDVQPRTLLSQLWALARINQYPEIAELVKSISHLVYKERRFKPNKIKQKIVAFWKSKYKDDEEVKAIWLGAASPHIKNLTERQREDVLAWFGQDQRKFFMLMLE